jgi:hypothetical protein
MASDSLKERLIKNELIIRDKNRSASRSLKKYFRGDKAVTEAPIAFVCECSILDCDEHVNLSISEYEAIHQRNDHFVIFKGHLTSSIEKIIQKHKDFDIVEKAAVPA